MKRLQIETIILAGLMVSIVAFSLTQVYNIHQLEVEHVANGVNQVMEVADSSS